MKKMFFVSVIASCALLLAGCSSRSYESEERPVSSEQKKRFEMVYEQTDWSASYEVVRDSETGVQYFVINEGIGQSARMGVSVLVDPDGKPLIEN